MMVRRRFVAPASTRSRRLSAASALAIGVGLTALGSTLTSAFAAEPNYPITEKQRATARQVAEAGVPLSELAPNAPDTYTVKRHDTLWDISKVFLKSPWRWPELWGMNLDQIRNPHLIYPGQVLYLDKTGGRARLSTTAPDGTVKLSPHARAEGLGDVPIASVPLHLIQPFLNEAVIFDTNELEKAPRIVATQEDRVILGRGDKAYVRGELGDQRDWRIFRSPTPLRDPTTNEILGYEAMYVGTAEYTRPAGTTTEGGKEEIVPATFTITGVKLEAGVGDRLAPVPPRDFTNYAPHAPSHPVSGQVVSLYGEALSAGQNQIVSINRGSRDGIERGTVLALLSDGQRMLDRTDPNRPAMKLPDEQQGFLFVFRVFDRMSYALIVSAQTSIKVGDPFTQP